MSKHQRETTTLATAALLIVCVVSASVPEGIARSSSHDFATATTLGNEVWVDDDFNALSPGWGLTHFQKIQDGINAVAVGGTVHISTGSYLENVMVDKAVSLLGEDSRSTVVDANYLTDTAISVVTNNVTIRGLTLKNCIYLGRENGALNISTWYNNVTETIFSGNWIDIVIQGRHNTIDSCTFSGSFWNVKLRSALSNSIVDSEFSYFHCAISLATSNNNAIKNNQIMHGTTAFSIFESIENDITANLAFNCSQNALVLESHSTRNFVTQNTFSKCYQAVSEDTHSNNNTFYHNSFINNAVQVSLAGGENKWDDGYPSGGNYWSDYNGADSNQDGIGDTPYVIDASNEDRYPLMSPSIKPRLITDINRDGKVNILDISAVAKSFGSRPGDPRWNLDSDVDSNGIINILDIAQVARDFGKTT